MRFSRRASRRVQGLTLTRVWVQAPSRRTRAMGVAETRDAMNAVARTEAFMMMVMTMMFVGQSEEGRSTTKGLRGRDGSAKVKVKAASRPIIEFYPLRGFMRTAQGRAQRDRSSESAGTLIARRSSDCIRDLHQRYSAMAHFVMHKFRISGWEVRPSAARMGAARMWSTSRVETEGKWRSAATVSSTSLVLNHPRRARQHSLGLGTGTRE